MTTKKTADTKKASGTTDVKPASEFDPSGAPHQTAQVDPQHPALDANPREDTSADQNRIDLNDPKLTDEQAVAKNLGLDTADTSKA